VSSTRCSARSERPARPRRDRGQATVELALTLPFVVVAVLVVLQVGVVVRAQVLVVHAAREAARAAAVGERPPPPDGLDPARTSVAIRPAAGGGRVDAEVTYRAETDLPLIGAVLPDLVLRGGATMRVE
jgi:hypothetical protein